MDVCRTIGRMYETTPKTPSSLRPDNRFIEPRLRLLFVGLRFTVRLLVGADGVKSQPGELLIVASRYTCFFLAERLLMHSKHHFPK